ncbi:hypothetical protein LCGC14_1738640, partial [marine sediment metagenome]
IPSNFFNRKIAPFLHHPPDPNKSIGKWIEDLAKANLINLQKNYGLLSIGIFEHR